MPVWNLVLTAHVVGLQFAERLAAVGLTPTQFAVLQHLEREPGLTQAELARLVLVRPQSMTPLITALQGQGLLIRDGAGGRGRRASLAISEVGRDALHRAWPVVRTLNTPQALGLTPAQVGMLNESLDHIRATLKPDT